ncbi:MAG: class I SAM-dependent methyltransferase [Pontimonas sp.]
MINPTMGVGVWLMKKGGGTLSGGDTPLGRHLRFLETFARHEAITKVASLRGSIAQVGVGDGFGLITLAKLHDLVAPLSTSTHFFGFDTFNFYPNPDEDELRSVEKLATSPHNRFGAVTREDVELRIAEYAETAPFSQRKKSRFRIVEGPVEETLDSFEVGGTRFKLVEIDVNLRTGTKKALEFFWPLLAPGGLLIFGSYSMGDWPGETDEVHEFLLREGLMPRAFQDSDYPSGFVVKSFRNNDSDSLHS